MLGYKNIVHFNEQCRPKWSAVQIFTSHNKLRCITKISDSVFVSGSYDGTIKLWNVNLRKNSNNCIDAVRGHNEPVISITKISESTFGSASWDDTIKLWNVDNADQLDAVLTLSDVTYINRPKTGIFGSLNMNWSDDDEELKCLAKISNSIYACGCKGGDVKLWNTNHADVYVRTFKGHNSGVYGITKMSNSTFVSGSNDGILKLWAY